MPHHRYWLMKSEPQTFSIGDLSRRPDQKDWWDGVRNYEARRYLKLMRVGDLAFFYHSSCAIPGIMGIIQITQAAQGDSTALDSKSPYFDPRATIEQPHWVAVEVQLVAQYSEIIPLKILKSIEPLQTMRLLQPGNRLSVMPVTPEEWRRISAFRA